MSKEMVAAICGGAACTLFTYLIAQVFIWGNERRK